MTFTANILSIHIQHDIILVIIENTAHQLYLAAMKYL